MSRPSAVARRMAQASVESRKEERVPGVDMVESPWEKALCTRKNVWWRLLLNFLKRDEAQGGTSYNNNESA